jgi:hypothetical protein
MGAQKKIEKKVKDTEVFDNLRDKSEIERMKKLISEKFKDPKTAKKAAFIIAEMLNKNN